MNKWWSGVLFLLIILVFQTVACVPVEEKTDIPFDVTLRNEAVRNIYSLQIRQEKDSLVGFLHSDDPSVRYAAARAFASFGDSTVLDPLLSLLHDPDVRVRAMVAEAIGLLGSPKAESQLTAAFDGRDSARLYLAANGAILEAMGRIGSAQSLRALSTISTYQNFDTLLLLGQVRGIYRYALRDMTDPEGTATIVKYLTDNDMPPKVRLIAAHYLHRAANINLAPHSDQLISIWHSERDPELRICIATALSKLKTPDARRILIESLPTESNYLVRCSILRSLQAYSYEDIHDVVLEFAKVSNPAVAEVAAQYFVKHGIERDAGKYRAAMDQCKTWHAKTRLAEAANKNMSSMFSAAKTNLQKDILFNLNRATNAYEKAAWLKAWASEIRNFESIPKYTQADQHVIIRTQAIQSLIDVCRDKNFDSYFAGEGHLIRSQIGGYLANAMRSNDAGILALIAGGITDPGTGLKAVMNDRKSELGKIMNNLELPEQMETYLEIAKALKEYNIETPPVPESKKAVKPMDWTALDKWKQESKARIVTSYGNIDLELYAERAPGSVANFIQLANQNFYDGKTFHRVVPGFVIQSGCPRGDGFGSLDFTIRSELAGAYYDDEGYLGMASAGPHTEGTQFFITHSPTPHLDGRYTIFGKVISGMEFVHQVSLGDTINEINILY